MRMRIGVTGAVLCVCISVFGQDAMFRRNAVHSGVYDAAGVPKFNQVKWSFHTGGMVIASPTVVGGVVYVGSDDGSFYAIDAGSGAQKWKFAVKSRVPSTAAVSGGVVYFTAYDGNLYALDGSNGQVKWKVQTGGERRFAAKHLHGVQPVNETMPDPFDCFLSSPVVWNGAVYFGSGDGNVYSVDAGSGALKWKFKTGEVVHASPAIADGTLYIGSWDSYFYALDAASGQERWRFKTGADEDIHNLVGIQSSAAIADGMVYFGCRDSHLYALDARTGEKKWAFSGNGSWVISSPAVRNGKVYFDTSDTSLVVEADAKTGAVLRSFNLNHWYLYSSPAIAGNTMYVGSTQGKLVAVDLEKFSPAWTFETEGMKRNGPMWTKPDGAPDEMKIFRSDFYDDMVAGVDRVMSMGSILGAPVVVGSEVYFGSADGNVYALM